MVQMKMMMVIRIMVTVITIMFMVMIGVPVLRILNRRRLQTQEGNLSAGAIRT